MSDYGNIWAGDYDLVHTRTEDISFWIEEAQASGGPVLELACGTGRVAIPIAQAGVPVVGLDNSTELLRVARTKVRRLELPADRLRFLRGDMRRLSLGQRFPLVIIPYSSFLLLLSVADQFQALEAIKEHLAPEGRLVIDVFTPDVNILTREPAVRVYSRERVDPSTGQRVVLGEQNQVDVFNQVITARAFIEEWDREGTLLRTTMKEYQLRYIFRFEMQHLLTSAGYAVDQVYGDYERDSLDEDSPRMVWVARAG